MLLSLKWFVQLGMVPDKGRSSLPFPFLFLPRPPCFLICALDFLVLLPPIVEEPNKDTLARMTRNKFLFFIHYPVCAIQLWQYKVN